jgi:hypothetical protein
MKGRLMKLKLIIAVSVFAAFPGIGQAQTGGPPAPKTTLADVQKVVQEINSDKAKLQAYCEMNKINEEAAEADAKKDTKAVEALGQKADSLAQTLGPDYMKMWDGLDQVDEDSPLGKQIAAALDTLDKQCK